MVFVRSVFRQCSIETIAQTVFDDPDVAAEFMDNGHRGEIAKFVLGDANEFVFPRHLDDKQQMKLKEYLENLQYRKPAPVTLVP